MAKIAPRVLRKVVKPSLNSSHYVAYTNCGQYREARQQEWRSNHHFLDEVTPGGVRSFVLASLVMNRSLKKYAVR